MRGVYLIHLDPPYRQAKHYLGYSEDISQRYFLHCAGIGARLTQVAVKAGCKLYLARIWPEQSRDFERWLKNKKNAPALCPICNIFHSLDELEEMEF